MEPFHVGNHSREEVTKMGACNTFRDRQWRATNVRYPRQHRPPNPTQLNINPSHLPASHKPPRPSLLQSRVPNPPKQATSGAPPPLTLPGTSTHHHDPSTSGRPAFTRVPHPAPEKAHPAPEPGMHPIYNPVPHQTRPNSAAAEPFENLCSCGYSGRPDRRNRPLPHSPLSAWLNLRKRRMFR